MLGSHNSRHLRPEPTLLAGIEAVSAELARDIEYSHRTLTEQSDDFGVRRFELDVLHRRHSGPRRPPDVHDSEPSTRFDSPYVVAFPGGAIVRCNPVAAPPTGSDDLLAEP